MMNFPYRIAVGLTASAIVLLPLTAEAKSKAFIKIGKKVCIGGACGNNPTPIHIDPIPIPDPTKVVTRVVDEGGRVLGTIAGNAVQEAGIGLGNLERESRRLGGQVDKNIRKSGNDVGMQLKRSQKDVGDLATAVYRYALHETHSAGKVANNFERRFREGKIVDALWHLGTDPIQESDKNAAEAAMASQVLSTIGSVAASVYGGPGGAAAYAAWLTYHKTCEAGKCDANLALRTGMIAAASTYANGRGSTIDDPFKRAATMGAIAGAAVAASGGKPSDINDAMFRAGASVLVQEGYRQYVGRDMLEESKGAFGDPMCMATVVQSVGPTNCPKPINYMKDREGKYLLQDKQGQWHHVAESELSTVPNDWKLVGDASSTPSGTPVVGIQTDKLPPSSWTNEGSTFMTAIAKFPGMNEMALFHDRWTVAWSMSSEAAVMGTIPVAMIITYTGDTLVYDAASSRAIIDAGLASSQSSSLDNSRTLVADRQPRRRSPLERFLRIKVPVIKAVAGNSLNPADDLTAPRVWAPQSILCDKGEQFQSYNVAWGYDDTDLRCAVVTTTGDVTSKEVAWYAKNVLDVCSSQIQEKALSLIKDGWSCKAR